MRSALIGALAFLVMGAPVMGEEGATRLGTVVELYTSQGCSSCPPADDYLRELATRPGVIALSLHVDYWDYIGWTDSFGQARFTERQKAYARAEGSRTIYTPQMIVAGGQRVEGVNPSEVDAAVQADQAMGAGLDLSVRREGDGVSISAKPAAGLAGPIRVQIVRFLPKAEVMIEAGENAGRMVTYTNVVTSWASLGDWDGQSALELTADAAGEDGVVVILQAVTVKDLPGRIYAAALAD